jgi:hypothetical protein
METPKICKDCMYYKLTVTAAVCTNVNTINQDAVDLVTGEKKSNYYKTCAELRRIPDGLCGPKGKYYKYKSGYYYDR